ncbi:SubName: Full=Uncharacterized protein {ECO:0000313/EMBL:CCA68783.1} [Serendipita indica DSM 11827]|uniref:Formin GTPase-binding domain-containing protein n=1 Tax=Serendipita indica (strain DSM 11827) TaxID=1109443 RepID=G4TBV6_SERID|nr:SubName: Full=Uncharacterized protein {ECO:0000313/EMBL:CCA68783.1} [Serendipita indica DSM 11827]CCA68783.1 hypothetical protein PIIN_02645 [Serendipita indica DSM 11827]
MFKGILKDPKRTSTQDVPHNTAFIDALGSAGMEPAHSLNVDSSAKTNAPEANKENRPATVRAELFLNLASSRSSVRATTSPSSPTKRSSVILPPSANLAMQINGGEETGRATPEPRAVTRGRSATVDPQGGPPEANRRRTESGSAIGVGSAQGWGFEFLDHPPPLSKEEEVKATTHNEFNKMLDDLQIPSTLRPKLEGLDTPVKAAMLKSSHVLTIPPPSGVPQLPSEGSVSPTKSKFGKDKEKTKDKKTWKEKDKFKTENFSESKQHAPNPFMFNRNGGASGKNTPKKGVRRTQSSGSLGDSPRGIPYSQMSPGGNGSSYQLGLGVGQEQALKYMFPSLEDDPFSRADSPPLMPPPTLAQLQDGYVGHVRGSSFDSSLGIPRPSSAQGDPKSASRTSLYFHGTGSSSGIGTSNGSGGSRNGTGNWNSGGTVSGLSMGLGNQSRPRVGSGSHGQAILVKDRTTSQKDLKNATVKERDWTPGRFSVMLSQTKSTELEVERLKKLRIMLRNEAAAWSESFLIEGGYSALLSRLNEMLEVEWREEQRDDQILHELLRCFKALSTSSIGCFALRSSAPRPFVQLISLLYSDKKPGDACSRILIVELLIILSELYPNPPSSPPPERPSSALGLTTTPRMGASTPLPHPQYPLPAPHTNLFSLMRAVLLTPKPLPSECPSMPISPHAFIDSLHHPRIYKSYLQEVSDCCRDYFWVFCHPSNTIWDLDAVDLAKVEAPRAPGGMTGGVEFEAMNYLTCHFKLLNAIGRAAADLHLPADNELSSAKYHHDMFMSGIEKILATSRKASTVYYPTLHLEIAKYIQLVREAGMELPFGLQRMVGPPPPPLCKPEYAAKTSSQAPPTKSVPRHTRSATEAPPMMSGAPQRANAGVPKGAAPPVLPVPRF